MSAMIWVLLTFVLYLSGANAFDLLSTLKDNSDLSLENVSEECRTQISLAQMGLNNSEAWAWTLIDASSKIPNGILYGNLFDLGNFDQYIAMEHRSEDDTLILGKFCALSVIVPFNVLTNQYNESIMEFPQEEIIALKVPKLVSRDARNMELTLSICIPNACTPQEIQLYFNLSDFEFNSDNCQTREKPDFDAGDIAVITFLSIVVFFMVASTIYDVYLHKNNQKSIYPIFLMFSVLTNGKKLLTVTENDNQINCLNGLRFISMTWIIVAHRFLWYSSMPITNAVDTITWMNSVFSQYISGAIIAVDTFFFLSGMMISYGYFKTVDKPKPLSFVPMLYLHRILRITPALAMVYFVSITIIRHMGSGPIWLSISTKLREPCLKWWWSFYLYIQNYVNYDDTCISATWYLSADMQLFLLSPFIVMPLGYMAVKSTKMTVYRLCGLLIIASTLIPFAINFFVEPKNAYYMTQNRLAIWMVGITAGIVLEEVKTKKIKVRINWMINFSVWIVVLVGMIAILLTMHEVKYNPERIKSNTFETYHRLGWGVGLFWIVYSCTVGYGGFINAFLSYKPFQVLSRLCYCMYLTHTLVILHSLYQIRSPSYFSDYHLYYIWCGDYITTMVVSLVWALAFESPMIIFEKIIFGGYKVSPPEPPTKYIGGTNSPDV